MSVVQAPSRRRARPGVGRVAFKKEIARLKIKMELVFRSPFLGVRKKSFLSLFPKKTEFVLRTLVPKKE